MPMVEDLSLFFSTAEFAHKALLDGAEVLGIFNGGYSTALGGIATGEPTFTLPTASAPTVAQGSELRIDVDGSAAAAGIPLSVNGAATVYRVRNFEPDGTGVTILRLELQ